MKELMGAGDFCGVLYHKDNEVVSISRRLQNGQHTTIACPTAIKDYN